VPSQPGRAALDEIGAPFVGHRVRVGPERIDVNRHMNATDYGLIVYDAHYLFCETLGLAATYVEATGFGTAVLESHMIYEHEVFGGDVLEVRSWLLGVDAKRYHFFHELMNTNRGVRAAASEQVDVHVDLSREIVRRHRSVPPPPGVGSRLRPPANDWMQVPTDPS
jgi:acyl-CoA thioester hydrolase